jgi:hypothetical protein
MVRIKLQPYYPRQLESPVPIGAGTHNVYRISFIQLRVTSDRQLFHIQPIPNLMIFCYFFDGLFNKAISISEDTILVGRMVNG